MLPALFAGIVVCGLYLSIQNKLEAESLKGQVLVMKENVAANIYVKPEDMDKYFETVAVEKTAISASAYGTISDLPKDVFYIDRAMTKSQMALQTDILTKDLVMDKYKSGYEIASFAAESFDDSVNGSLRKGDIVDVSAGRSGDENSCCGYLRGRISGTGNRVIFRKERQIRKSLPFLTG